MFADLELISTVSNSCSSIPCTASFFTTNAFVVLVFVQPESTTTVNHETHR
jgi:hypothetical protein